MLLATVLVIFGLILLVLGADRFVEGASSLAAKFNISQLAIGLTVVAFGTSAPELVVNSFASYQGNFDIVFANIIGSNNFNLFIILGLAGIITPMTVQSGTAWREIPFSLFCVILLFILVNDAMLFGSSSSGLNIADGAILFLFFIVFLFYVYKQLKNDIIQEQSEKKILSNIKIIIYIIFGLAALIYGGKLVVDNAVKLATVLGMSEKVIGMTIIAAGTSLPELATSIVAAIRKNSDIAIGNIVGSNIFNILLIFSISTFVNPSDYNISFNTDLYILAGGTLFLILAMYTGKIKKLDRWEAALLLIFYVAYTTYAVINEV